MRNKWLIAVGFVLLWAGSLALSGWYWKRQYKNQIEEQKKILTDSLTASFEAQMELVEQGKTHTATTRKKAKTIDDKLKQDEKAIDDSTVTDAELSQFLAEYD